MFREFKLTSIHSEIRVNMVFGEVEVNRLDQIKLILEAKLADDPL